MVETGPPRLSSVPTVKGGPVLLSRRRQPIGWPALFLSITLHATVFAFAAWLSLGGQGDDGDTGTDKVDAGQAAAEPIRQLMPKPESQTFRVMTRPVKALRTANLPRILAHTPSAALLLPQWDMPASAIISLPPSTAVVAPPLAVADTTPKTASAPKAQRKAAGKGSGSGSGSAKLAAKVPQLLSSFAPNYPPSARRANIQGCATIKVTVGSTGRVVSCSIYHSTGNEDLDTAALRAVKNWRFTPAVNGAADVLVRVNFKLA